MSAFDEALARWFHDHHGIASTSDLAHLGVTDDQRRHLLEIAVLESPFEGVYRLVSTPLDIEARSAAVCAADPSLVISCHTAGRLYLVRQCASRFIHATTERLTKPIGAGVKIHRSRMLPSDHIIDRGDGIRVTSPARFFFDMARYRSDLTLRSIGEQLLADRLCTLDDLAALVVEMATPGRPGGRRAKRVLAERSRSGQPADSHLEVVLLDALHRAGYPEFERHPEVRLPTGALIHPDMGVPAAGFYVEVDHPTWHDATKVAEYDKHRDRQVRLAGADVERVTAAQIETRLHQVVAEVTSLYARRLRRLGSHRFGAEAG